MNSNRVTPQIRVMLHHQTSSRCRNPDISAIDVFLIWATSPVHCDPTTKKAHDADGIVEVLILAKLNEEVRR